jgi:hypothetical protein
MPIRRKRKNENNQKSKIPKGELFEDRILRWNPQLECEFGPYLLNETVENDSVLLSYFCWDNLIDRFIGSSPSVVDIKLSIERLEHLHEANISFFLLLIDIIPPQLLNAAMFAGFFPFAIGLELGSEVCQENSGILSLEFAGLCQEKTPESMGGRIILHDLQQLIVGKRALKEISKMIKSDLSQSFSLQLSTTWSDLESAFDTLIQHHGLDWLGYSRVKNGFQNLYNLHDKSVQMVVFKLLKKTTHADSHSKTECMSLEIGYLTGACYTCLSNWSDSTIPRIGQVRSAAVPIFLHQFGIRLFDVGGIYSPSRSSSYLPVVTAEYYVNLNGYHRSTRTEFTLLWREYRRNPCLEIQSSVNPTHEVDVVTLLQNFR